MTINDWRVSENYSYTSNHDISSWAWEFIRRSPNYQQAYLSAFERHLNSSADSYSEKPVVLATPDSRDFALHPIDDTLGIHFNLRYWLAPHNERPRYLEFVKETITAPITIFEKDAITYEQLLSLVRNIKRYSVVHVLDLEQPIQPQLKLLETKAKKLVKYVPEWKKKKRTTKATSKRTADWSLYLRVLDAEATGIKRARAAETLFGNTDNSLRKWDETLKQAKAFRDSGIYSVIP